MKNKWRNIRDNFVRSFNYGKTGESGGKKRKYVFSDALQFLEKTLDRKNINDNNMPQDNHVGNKPMQVNVIHDLPPTVPSSTSIIANAESVSDIKSNQSTKKLPMSKFQSELLKKLESCHDCNDPDKLYLLSLLPLYKTLTDIQKLQLQQQILNFMMSVKQNPHQAAHTSTVQPGQPQFNYILQFPPYQASAQAPTVPTSEPYTFQLPVYQNPQPSTSQHVLQSPFSSPHFKPSPSLCSSDSSTPFLLSPHPEDHNEHI